LEQVYYIEDYPINDGEDTDRRTMTKADIINSVRLTGDDKPQHVEAGFIKQEIFRKRTAHGIFISIWSLDYGYKASFLSPIKIGDTIHCRY